MRLPFYQEASDSHRMEGMILPDAGVVLIEGVFLQRTEWRGFFDYLVYLDCPRSKRFSRESRATQENIEKFRNRYWKAEDYYLKTAAPREQADLLINT